MLQGAASGTQSKQHETKLQSEEQQTTKTSTADTLGSGVNSNTPSDTIMAAHGPQQVANGQSNMTPGQTTSTPEQTVGTQAHSKTSKKSSKSKDSTVKTTESHVKTDDSNQRPAPVIASQTEALDQANTQAHSAANRGTGDKTALPTINCYAL